MGYKIFADSSNLFEFADEMTRLSVFDALIIRGKITKYKFDGPLLIQKQKKTSDLNAFINDQPVECLEVGGKYFISEKIKNIFLKHQVKAEYFKTLVKIGDKLFDENYYLFNPLTGIDCLDYNKSTFIKEYDDWSSLYNISDISSVVINESLVPDNVPLFFLGRLHDVKEGGNITLDYLIFVTDKLANDLLSADIRGLNIFDIDKYRYDWKWKAS